jgi:integrase/recombinase XerC
MAEPQWIDDYLAHLAGERRYSPRTVRNYGQAVRGFFAWLRAGGYAGSIDAVPETTLKSWLIEQQRTGVGRRTLHLHASALRGYYRYLLRWQRIARNPLHALQVPAYRKPLPQFLTADQMERLLGGPALRLQAGTNTQDQALTDQLMFELLYGAGLRVSELVGLRFGDVDQRQQMLRVRGKGGKERLVPCGPAAAALIAVVRTQRQPAADDAVLASGGRPLTAGWVQRRLKVYLADAGLPMDLTPHKIRHSYATHLLQGGCDLRLLQELLGHSSLSTTQVYTHLDVARLQVVHRQAHPRG